MTDNIRGQLKPLLMSAKITQLCADIFAVFGIFLFAYIYFKVWNNNPWMALRDPFFVSTIFIPFVPAACFAYSASKKRKKIRALLEQSQNQA
jgi:hypothetical protein